MDKIREEFENDFNIDSIYEYDGKWYTTDGLKKATEVQKLDCTTLNRILYGYRKGYKSRDEEIKELKQDCKNLVDINNNQAEIMKSKGREIKKLRESLKKGK